MEEQPADKEDEEESEHEDAQSQYTQSTAPMLSSTQYSKYIKSLIKLLMGENVLNEWIREGMIWFNTTKQPCFNPLPDDKILDWFKLKQIADDILKCI